jgi:hypothetical protein
MASEIKANKISPATGTAFTIGDSGDTFTVPSGATIVNSGTATGFGGGKILQVINGTILGESFSSTSASFVDVTGVNATIVPSATSSKILVMMHTQIGNGSTNYGTLVRIVTGTSTEIFTGTNLGSRQSAFGGIGSIATGASVDISSTYIHEPSTTSSLTYKLQVYCESGGTARIGASGNNGNSAYHPFTPTYINLMEIGA